MRQLSWKFQHLVKDAQNAGGGAQVQIPGVLHLPSTQNTQFKQVPKLLSVY